MNRESDKHEKEAQHVLCCEESAAGHPRPLPNHARVSDSELALPRSAAVHLQNANSMESDAPSSTSAHSAVDSIIASPLSRISLHVPTSSNQGELISGSDSQATTDMLVRAKMNALINRKLTPWLAKENTPNPYRWLLLVRQSQRGRGGIRSLCTFCALRTYAMLLGGD